MQARSNTDLKTVMVRDIKSASFKNKYRVTSTRLKNWDYSCNGMYSVTICAKGRKMYFGDIEN